MSRKGFKMDANGSHCVSVWFMWMRERGRREKKGRKRDRERQDKKERVRGKTVRHGKEKSFWCWAVFRESRQTRCTIDGFLFFATYDNVDMINDQNGVRTQSSGVLFGVGCV